MIAFPNNNTYCLILFRKGNPPCFLHDDMLKMFSRFSWLLRSDKDLSLARRYARSLFLHLLSSSCACSNRIPASCCAALFVWCLAERCWKSGTFPLCDGSHVAHNKESGDNVGPLIVSGPKAGE